jgi:flagellar basal-body rod modification protein FlgD
VPSTAIPGLQAATVVTQSATGRTPSPDLDKNAFLRLMVAQLKNQDPSSAQDLSQQMAQVAQMSIVEQLTNLNTATQKLATAAEASHAQALVGRTVTYVDGDGVPVTGVVESVTKTDDGRRLTVAGKAGIDPSTLTEVR